MPLSYEVAVPAQYGVRSDDESQSAQDFAGEGLEESGQEGPVLRCELRLAGAELPLQDGDLVAQGQDLGVLVPVAHR